MEEIIKIENLSKRFKDVLAVNDLSFSVKKGELFAFLGVNGAGKSTTINILCGQLPKDSGKVYIDGIEIEENSETIKNKIGVVFQDGILDKPLTVKDNLQSRACLYGITGKAFEKRLEELSKTFAFTDLLNRPVGKLSGGQRRRIDIARALIHKPSVLVLDEPTTGLDPQTRKAIWEIISKMQKENGMTVLLTTHYMEEAAEADNVVIINKGEIVASGTPLELKNKYTGDYITVYNQTEDELKKLSVPYEKWKEGYRLYVANTNEAKNLICKYPNVFNDFEITKGKMDDVFLSVTGISLTGDKEQ